MANKCDYICRENCRQIDDTIVKSKCKKESYLATQSIDCVRSKSALLAQIVREAINDALCFRFCSLRLRPDNAHPKQNIEKHSDGLRISSFDASMFGDVLVRMMSG